MHKDTRGLKREYRWLVEACRIVGGPIPSFKGFIGTQLRHNTGFAASAYGWKRRKGMATGQGRFERLFT